MKINKKNPQKKCFWIPDDDDNDKKPLNKNYK